MSWRTVGVPEAVGRRHPAVPARRLQPCSPSNLPGGNHRRGRRLEISLDGMVHASGAHCNLASILVLLCVHVHVRLFTSIFKHVLLFQEFSADSTTNVHVFNYDASDSDVMRLLVPPLNYVAPELISGNRATGALTSATDTYSFGERQKITGVS